MIVVSCQDNGLGKVYRAEYGVGLGFNETGLVITEYPIAKVTECGVRFFTDYQGEGSRGKFVNNEARKQWASRTVEKAIECFIARKRRQIEICSAQVSDAKDGMAVAEAELARRQGTEAPAGVPTEDDIFV